MKITEAVLHDICEELCIVPPEKGGIIGSINGIVCDYCMDDGTVQAERYAYVPNVEKLNSVIDQWSDKGVCFAGMFHSHPYPQTELSAADREYIETIMGAMPDSISELHFPVIVPGLGVTGHLAKYRDGEVIVVPEDIIIVKE